MSVSRANRPSISYLASQMGSNQLKNVQLANQLSGMSKLSHQIHNGGAGAGATRGGSNMHTSFVSSSGPIVTTRKSASVVHRMPQQHRSSSRGLSGANFYGNGARSRSFMSNPSSSLSAAAMSRSQSHPVPMQPRRNLFQHSSSSMADVMRGYGLNRGASSGNINFDLSHAPLTAVSSQSNNGHMFSNSHRNGVSFPQAQSGGSVRGQDISQLFVSGSNPGFADYQVSFSNNGHPATGISGSTRSAGKITLSPGTQSMIADIVKQYLSSSGGNTASGGSYMTTSYGPTSSNVQHIEIVPVDNFNQAGIQPTTSSYIHSDVLPSQNSFMHSELTSSGGHTGGFQTSGNQQILHFPSASRAAESGMTTSTNGNSFISVRSQNSVPSYNTAYTTGQDVLQSGVKGLDTILKATNQAVASQAQHITIQRAAEQAVAQHASQQKTMTNAMAQASSEASTQAQIAAHAAAQALTNAQHTSMQTAVAQAVAQASAGAQISSMHSATEHAAAQASTNAQLETMQTSAAQASSQASVQAQTASLQRVTEQAAAQASINNQHASLQRTAVQASSRAQQASLQIAAAQASAQASANEQRASIQRAAAKAASQVSAQALAQVQQKSMQRVVTQAMAQASANAKQASIQRALQTAAQSSAKAQRSLQRAAKQAAAQVSSQVQQTSMKRAVAQAKHASIQRAAAQATAATTLRQNAAVNNLRSSKSVASSARMVAKAAARASAAAKILRATNQNMAKVAAISSAAKAMPSSQPKAKAATKAKPANTVSTAANQLKEKAKQVADLSAKAQSIINSMQTSEFQVQKKKTAKAEVKPAEVKPAEVSAPPKEPKVSPEEAASNLRDIGSEILNMAMEGSTYSENQEIANTIATSGISRYGWRNLRAWIDRRLDDVADQLGPTGELVNNRWENLRETIENAIHGAYYASHYAAMTSGAGVARVMAPVMPQPLAPLIAQAPAPVMAPVAAPVISKGLRQVRRPAMRKSALRQVRRPAMRKSALRRVGRPAMRKSTLRQVRQPAMGTPTAQRMSPAAARLAGYDVELGDEGPNNQHAEYEHRVHQKPPPNMAHEVWDVDAGAASARAKAFNPVSQPAMGKASLRHGSRPAKGKSTGQRMSPAAARLAGYDVELGDEGPNNQHAEYEHRVHQKPPPNMAHEVWDVDAGAARLG